MAREYIKKKGKDLFLFGKQITVFDVRSFYHIKKILKSYIANSDRILYNAGRQTANTLSNNFYDFLGDSAEVFLSDKRNALANFIDVLNWLGFGEISIAKSDFKNLKIVFVVKHSAEAQEFVNRKEITHSSVCYATAGIFAGLCEILFKLPLECKETRCIACGDDFCEFVIKKGEMEVRV
jgi:predicted hydrocarbon binding protein